MNIRSEDLNISLISNIRKWYALNEAKLNNQNERSKILKKTL